MGPGIELWLKERRWHGLLALTLVPVLIATLLLQLLGPVGAPISALEMGLLKGALTREPFLAGILSLVAVLSVHLCICLCGLGLARSMLARSDEDRSFFWFGVAVGVLVGAAVVLLSFWTQADGQHALTVYRLTYDFFHDLYSGSGAGLSLLRPRLLGVDAVGWSILIPTLLGIIGVGALTAAAGAELRHLPEPPTLPNEPYEVQLETAQGRLKRSLYVLTLGLVASTIAVSLFFHLPSKLSQNDFRGGPPALAWNVGGMSDAQIAAATARAELVGKAQAMQGEEMKAIRAKLDDFAGELTIFWGAVFTLTLLAAGAVPLLLLERRVRRYAENSADAAAVAAAEDRLAKAGLLSGGLDQVKLVAAVIAPLASGQIAGLVQMATGAG
jgi:hypothetical protein